MCKHVAQQNVWLFHPRNVLNFCKTFLIDAISLLSCSLPLLIDVHWCIYVHNAEDEHIKGLGNLIHLQNSHNSSIQLD